MTDIEIVLQAIVGDNFSEEKRNCWRNQKLENSSKKWPEIRRPEKEKEAVNKLFS